MAMAITVWFLIVFCCQSMFRVPTGWLALGKVCESRDPKFTWEGVESIRFSRLACQVRVLFLSQTWLMIWLDMFPLSSCRFACGFEHHSFCFYTYLFFLSRPDDFFKNFKIFRQFPRSSFHWIRYGRGLSLSVQLDPATTLRQQLRKVRLLRCGWRAVRSRCFFGWLKTTVTIGVVHITPGCKINIYRCIIYEYSTSQLMSLFVCLLVGLLVCWFVRSFVCLFACLSIATLTLGVVYFWFAMQISWVHQQHSNACHGIRMHVGIYIYAYLHIHIRIHIYINRIWVFNQQWSVQGTHVSLQRRYFCVVGAGIQRMIIWVHEDLTKMKICWVNAHFSWLRI